MKGQSGQGLTEYAVILSLVAIAAIASMAFFGGAIKAKIAALSGAVAGSKVAEVNKAEQMSKKSADSAVKRAKNVNGTTAIDSDDIFDSEKLGSG